MSDKKKVIVINRETERTVYRDRPVIVNREVRQIERSHRTDSPGGGGGALIALVVAIILILLLVLVAVPKAGGMVLSVIGFALLPILIVGVFVAIIGD